MAQFCDLSRLHHSLRHKACFSHDSPCPKKDPSSFVGRAPPLARLALSAFLAVAAGIAIENMSAAEPSGSVAEVFLRDVKGLTPIPGGKVWMCRAECTLRDALAKLDDSRRDLIQQQRTLEQRVRANRQQWELILPSIAALKAARSAAATDAPERPQIDRQIALLGSQAVDPERLGSRTDVRASVIRLNNARHALALSLLTIRRAVPRMEADYRGLQSDSEVQTALRALGGGHRLGPLETYRRELRRAEAYEQLVFTPWVPIYIQSDRIRVDALLNERTPITFSWRVDQGPTMLTDSMLEAAGLDVPATAPTVSLQAAPGRMLNTRQMNIPALRFGQTVLHDVPVYALGPDGEDLGAVIGADVFTGYTVQLELSQLRLSLAPASG